MGEKLLSNKAPKIAVEDIVQKVMDIFEAEDGRVFEEKKKEVIEYLKNQEDTLLAERVLSAAINDEKGRCWKEKFWQAGETLQSNGHVILRKVKETDTLECPIIHRDIKPSNVMLTKSGEVVLLDMNVAKWYDSEEKEDTRLLGTKDYAAPEQAGYGMKASSDKTDIYAVGILLNVMLTGKLPKEKPAQGKLWDIIERCISLDADTRYSADELIERLDNYLGENTNAGKKDR